MAQQICICQRVFLSWNTALLIISMLLRKDQCALMQNMLQEKNQPQATYRELLSHLRGHIPALFPRPPSSYYWTTLPTIPKQHHLCFSFFSGFPTLNATQTSPSALLRPLWKPARWHSQQPCVQHRTSAAHSKWCHCPPEQTVSRVRRKRKRKRKRRERWRREGGEGVLGEGKREKTDLWGRTGRVTAYVQ